MQPQGAPLAADLDRSTAWQGKAWFRQRYISKNECEQREAPSSCCDSFDGEGLERTLGARLEPTEGCRIQQQRC